MVELIAEGDVSDVSDADKAEITKQIAAAASVADWAVAVTVSSASFRIVCVITYPSATARRAALPSLQDALHSKEAATQLLSSAGITVTSVPTFVSGADPTTSTPPSGSSNRGAIIGAAAGGGAVVLLVVMLYYKLCKKLQKWKLAPSQQGSFSTLGGAHNVQTQPQQQGKQTPPSKQDREGADDSTQTAKAMLGRLADVTSDALLGPISGIEQSQSMSLMEAALHTEVTNIEMHAYIAVEKAKELQANGEIDATLSVDEVAAITLYTMESEFYPTLNKLLRSRDRQGIKIFFPYLKLLLAARAKLPKYSGVVWRGVKGRDLREKFPKGKEVYWWAFSSSSKELSTLQNPMFLGKEGTRTVFNIEAINGVDIVKYSMFQGEKGEAEVLLFPGTKLVVIDTMDMGAGLFQVHLKEVVAPKLIG